MRDADCFCPRSGGRRDVQREAREQPGRGRAFLSLDQWERGAVAAGAGRGERDARIGGDGHVSEQMAFIYILQKWSSSVALASILFLFVRFVNGSDEAFEITQKA